MKIIKIMDYSCTKVPIKIKNFEDVVRLTIEVVSGDEILHILYKNYTEEQYDSCYMLKNFRINSFYDGEYVIYDITKNINKINKWNKRKDMYDYFGKVDE